MKVLVKIVLIALFFNITAIAQVTSINLISPNGGEVFLIGKEYNITWTSVSYGDVTVKIEYSTDNGSTWKTITNGTHAQNGTFPWQVKKGISSQCKVRIVSNNNSSINDVSAGNFEIKNWNQSTPSFVDNVTDGVINSSLWIYSESGNSCQNPNTNEINKFIEDIDEVGDTAFIAQIVSSYTCSSRLIEASLQTSNQLGMGNFYNTNSEVVIDLYGFVSDGCYYCDQINDSDLRYFITDGVSDIEFYRPNSNSEGIEEGCQCATVFATISNDRRHIFTFKFNKLNKTVRVFKGDVELPNSPFDLSTLNERWSLKLWGKSHSFQTAYGANVSLRIYEYKVFNSEQLQVDFFDDFENLDRWTLYGSPLPQHITSIFGASGIFDNNGDPNYNSGGVSKNQFDLTSGFILESQVYLDFTNLSGCWAGASIGTSEAVYQNWGGYDPEIYFSLFANGDACWGSPPSTRRRTMLIAGYKNGPNSGDWESLGNLELNPTYADHFANKWVNLKIVVDASYIPKFFVNDSLIFTGATPIFETVMANSKSVWLGDRSSGSAGKAYHNWVKLMLDVDENPFHDENFVLLGPLSECKVSEGIKIKTFDFFIDQNLMLANNYEDCQRVGDYIVYSKDARSLDPIDWNAENGTAFIGDRLPANLRIKFAWKSDGTVFMGAVGSDIEALSTLVDGVHWTASNFYFTNTFFEGYAIRSEIKNLQNSGFITGLPHLDSLNTEYFHEKLEKKIYNRFDKKIYKIGSAVTLSGWPANQLSPDWAMWTTLSGIGTGSGSRNFSLNYNNPLNFYIQATASNDNGNYSYIKVNNSIVAHMSKWETNFYRRSEILPEIVEIGATNSWSGCAPAFRMAIIADSVWASNISQTPVGGLSNNQAPIIYSILPWKSTTNVKSKLLPNTYSLSQNYPNPFNPITHINYSIEKAGLHSIKIYNQIGEEITTLVEGYLAPGDYVATFNATNLPSGVYFYQLQTNGIFETKKLILLK